MSWRLGRIDISKIFRGANVIAVTTSAKAETLIELGAYKTFNRGDDYVAELGANSLDVVIDLVAGPKWPSLLEVLKTRGRYVAAGAIAGPLVELDVQTLYLKDLSLLGCTILDTEVFGNLIKRIENKEIKPLVAESYSLRDIGQAQQTFTNKTHIGKIVLEIPEY